MRECDCNMPTIVHTSVHCIALFTNWTLFVCIRFCFTVFVACIHCLSRVHVPSVLHSTEIEKLLFNSSRTVTFLCPLLHFSATDLFLLLPNKKLDAVQCHQALAASLLFEYQRFGNSNNGDWTACAPFVVFTALYLLLFCHMTVTHKMYVSADWPYSSTYDW